MYAPEKMLHWFCAHNKQTIARDHPSIFQHFKEGGFSIRRTSRKISKVSPDRVIEQSKNKYKKSQGNLEESM